MKFKNKYRLFNKMTYGITLSLIISSIIPLLIYITWGSIQVSTKLQDTEKVMLQTKVDYSNQIFDTKINELKSISNDYSIWGLAYQKILEKDTSWLKTNYSKSITTHFDVDLVIVIDRNHSILDKTNVKDSEINKLFKDNIIQSTISAFEYNSYELLPLGYKIFNGDLYLISINPIVDREFSKNYAGILVLGKKIDNFFLNDIKNKYNLNQFVSFNNKNIFMDEDKKIISDYFNPLTNISTSKTASTIILDNKNIIEKYPIKDISNTNIGYIYVIQSRDYILSILSSLHNSGFIVFIITILIIIVLNIYLNKKVVYPIKNLQNQIDKLSESNKLNYVDVAGPTEIQHLASVFNNLIYNITTQEKENASLKTLSITDELTTLYTRKHFYEYLQNIISKSTSNGAIIANDVNNNCTTLLVCNIDNFKIINNINGHEIGNIIIFELATIIKKEIHSVGTAFRYGGDQFAIVLHNNTIEESYKIAEDIRLGLKYSSIIQKYSKFFPISLSIGIASYPINALNMEELINNASTALLFSKQNGRNQSSIYNENIATDIYNTEQTNLNDEALLNSALALAAALDAKDIYTGNHSEYVAKYALALSEKLNLSEKDKHILSIGGLLHDCGKIGVPDEIIKKQGPLTNEEYDVMKKHAVIGSDIIRHIINTQEIFSCIRHHHERWDGNGYPDKLAGTNIPIHARIIGIADAYHAMISDRPYRKGLSKEIAFEEIRKNSGSQFSPELVEPFIEAVKDL